MEIERIDDEKDENYFRFVLRDVSPAFANALRRIMLAEVPCMAIDEIMILENTSPLYDEVLAHRLGLTPLTTDLESYVLPCKCTCGGTGCSACEVSLTIEKEAKEEIEVVYSEDLQSQDPKIAPVTARIPILKMAKGQKILVQAQARLGTGKQHAKWQPVATTAYKYYPIVNINASICTQCKECIDLCPRHILKASNDKKIKIEVQNIVDCIFCRQCEDLCPVNAIIVEETGKDFIFQVESTGTMPARQILTEAVKILQNKANELANKIIAIEET